MFFSLAAALALGGLGFVPAAIADDTPIPAMEVVVEPQDVVAAPVADDVAPEPDHEAASAPADDAAVDSEPATASASAGVSGTVTDADGDEVEGATVTAVTWPGAVPAGETTTDESGFYLLGGLAAGTYRIHVSGPDDSYLDAYETVELEAGCVITCFDFELEFSCECVTSIVGTVLDGDGEPLEGATVTATMVGTATTYTGAVEEDGWFEIVDLPAGKYDVLATYPARSLTATAMDVTVEECEESEVDVVIEVPDVVVVTPPVVTPPVVTPPVVTPPVVTPPVVTPPVVTPPAVTPPVVTPPVVTPPVVTPPAVTPVVAPVPTSSRVLSAPSTVTSAFTPTVTPRSASAVLASTGADVQGLVGWAVSLLLLGALTTAFARRRLQASPPVAR